MASSCRPEPQEHYYAYMLRRTREENAKERKMNDQAMIDKLRTMAPWTTEEPWTEIADRLEELTKE